MSQTEKKLARKIHLDDEDFNKPTPKVSKTPEDVKKAETFTSKSLADLLDLKTLDQSIVRELQQQIREEEFKWREAQLLRELEYMRER